MDSTSNFSGIEIAVIGMSCRFPGANNYREFWNNLVNGVESVSYLSNEEIKELNIPPDRSNDQNFVRTKGAVVDNKDKFDYSFFGYSDKEASAMDPQMRIMHECIWEALEDAACNPLEYQEKIGLIAGLSSNYSWLQHVANNKENDLGYFHTSTLVEKDFSVLNVAYRLNLKGPCFSLFTTCSTSLVAIHQACRALLMGESRIMLAGGVSISNETMKGYIHQEGMILSSDGHCRAFDKNSSGTVRGEGAGFVVLKRLKNAIEDNDNIYAIIKGSAINNDGNRKVGFFAPSINGQKEVISAALKIAKVLPETISYVEAHGTATNIGDPVEISGLTQAFNTAKKQYCGIGSVKTNIGHLDAAAGVAGFIKTVLCLKNRKKVPSINYHEPNPHINFPDTPFYVVNKAEEWNENEGLLRAGVSSFGIGGSNAHIILENYEQQKKQNINKPELFIVSARTQQALNKIKDNLNLLHRLKTNNSNLAYTLQVGRAKFPVRDFATTETLKKTGYLFKSCDDQQKSVSEVLLLLPDIKVPNLKRLLELLEYNDNLNPVYERFCLLIKEQHHCSIQDLSISLSKHQFESILGFIYQYTVVDFFVKLGATPQTIIASGIGELTMCCINGIISIAHAVELIFSLNKGKRLEVASIFENYSDIILSCRIKYYLPSIGRNNSDEAVIEDEKLNYSFGTRNILLASVGKSNTILSAFQAQNETLALYERSAQSSFNNILIYIGTLWKNGYSVDFNYFNRNATSFKISIPTYPFDCLVPISSKPIPDELVVNETVPKSLFYKLIWQKEKLNRTINPSADGLIFFTSNTEFEKKLIKKLLNKKKELYILDPSKLSDEELSSLIKNVKSNEIKIFILLGFRNHITDISVSFFENELNSMFFKWIDLVRLFGNETKKTLEIDFILNCSFDVTGIETTNVALSPISAIVKIIPLEMPNINCRIIDLNKNIFDVDSQKLFVQVANSNTNQQIIAIRNNSLWIRRLQPYVLANIDKRPSYIKNDGLYLFTGGLGGISFTIAKYLLENTKVSIILVGRTKQDEIKINKSSEYNELKIFKRRVHYYSSDISDFDRFSKLAQVIKKKHGYVDGIFHAAGIADFGGIVQRRSNESINHVLKPKVYGLINLFQLFNDNSLDFLALFSSVGNILYKDKVGQIAYNAANEFLDAFCNLSPKVISINWCDWKERGMTVDSINIKFEDKLASKIINGLDALSNTEGIEVLNYILNDNIQNVIVYKSDLFAALKTISTIKYNKIAPQATLTIDHVKKSLRQFFLSFFSISVDDDNLNFFDLGADSLTIIDSLPRINQLFDIKLSINDFYTCPSISELSNAIMTNKRLGFNKKIEQIAVKLGSGKKLLFAFPPAVGLGFLAYNRMSELLSEYTIYAFNFLKDNDRISKYASFINDVVQNDTGVLIGYSAGGTLAFEVAKAIEKDKITDLVILDTYIYRLRFTAVKEERKLLKDFLDEIRKTYDKEISQLVAPLMARFYFYVNNMISEGKIDANIHLIKATDRDLEEQKNKIFVEKINAIHRFKQWSELTKAKYYEYQGFGIHNDMLNGESYKQNIHILLDILNKNNENIRNKINA